MRISRRLIVALVALTLALALAAPAVADAASAGGLCDEDTQRGSTPSDFALDACFDGETMHIRNQIKFPIAYEGTGDVGVAKRTSTDFGLTAMATRTQDEPRRILPGDTVHIPVGAGSARFLLRGSNSTTFYFVAKVIETYFPVPTKNAKEFYDAFAGMVSELSAGFDQYRDCLVGASFLDQLGCRATFLGDATFAVSRAGFKTISAIELKEIAKKALGAIIGSYELASWVDGQPKQVLDVIKSPTLKLAQLSAATTTITPVAVPTADAGGAAPVILVLDTSTSMTEDDGNGRVKIEGAKSALLDFVRGVESQTPIGLRTYPDPTVDNCSAGALQFPVAARDPGSMAARIRTITAEGDTPTSAAMLAAADDLRDGGYTSGTMILVSDGESNCESTPCETAKEIEASGITLQTIAIGFQISEKGQEELECIAEAFDGVYVDADDNERLAEVLDRVSRPIVDLGLDYPDEVTAEVGDDGGYVTVKATITNSGGQEARNVKARLRFDDGAPGVAAPVRALGNLGAQQSRVVEWRFRPSVLLVDKVVRFTVLLRSENSESDTDATGAVRVRDTTGAGEAGPILKRSGRLVILGDSYSSGEGSHDYLAGTDEGNNRCHRSRHTYLFDAFKLPDENLLACSGAVTRDIASSHDGYRIKSQSAQLVARLSADERIAAVAMSLGGNDVGFGTLAAACITTTKPADGCDKQISTETGPRSPEDFLAAIADVTQQLNDAYVEIHSALNSEDNVRRQGVTPIMVVGYPLVTPQSKYRRSCLNALTLSAGELAYLVQFIHTLNGHVEAAVAQARSQSGVPVYYVENTESAFQPDHSLCDREPYGVGPTGIRAPGAGGDPIRRAVQELFHPNRDGYKALTRAIIRWSLGPEAKAAMADLKTRTAVEDKPLEWNSSDVDLGQIDSGFRPQLQGGTSYPLTLSGFAPNAQVVVELHSRAVTLAIAQSDGTGRLRTSVPVPRHLPSGKHTLKIAGAVPGGRPKLIVIPVELAGGSKPLGVRVMLFGAIGCWLLAVAGLAVAFPRRLHGAPE